MFTLESVYWFLKSAGFVRPTVNKVELDLFINPSRKIAFEVAELSLCHLFFYLGKTLQLYWKQAKAASWGEHLVRYSENVGICMKLLCLGGQNPESAKWRAQRAHMPYVPYVPTRPTCLVCFTCPTCPRAQVYFTDRKIKKYRF